MGQKVLITLSENDVAARFDLATEVLIVTSGTGRPDDDRKTLVLAHSSAEELCQLILDEGVDVVICGGIEAEYYDYLVWKKVHLLDSVMGPWERVLNRFNKGVLKPGSILFQRPRRKFHG